MSHTIETERVWELLAADVRRYLERRVEPGSVDDLVQEVFVRLHDRRAELRAADRVAPWVFRIARSVAVDHLRRRRPLSELPAEIPDGSDEDDDLTPEQMPARPAATTARFRRSFRLGATMQPVRMVHLSLRVHGGTLGT